MGLFTLAQEVLSPLGMDGTFSHAFGAPEERSAAGYTLRLFGKLNGLPPNLLDRGDGDFIAQTGTFYFRGKTGTRALESLFEHFDGKRFPWSECRGHFAIVLRWQRRLFLANDALGAYKIYHDRERRFFSSSFVAVQEVLPRVTIDKQGCYEYAWNGATFGEKTFLHEIRMLRQGMLLELTTRPCVLDEWNLAPSAPSTAGFEETAQRCAARLRELFRIYAAGGGGPFRLPLSGGYDSRLLLALLLDAGVQPELFVYGPPGHRDVQLAHEVARGEGLRIEHIDKRARVSALDAGRRLERAHDCLDGWHAYGLFDTGADAEDRLARAAEDRLLFNGSVGEIYRNFFNLPDVRYQPRDLVSVFYSYFSPRACTPAFDVREYESGMIADLRRAIPIGGTWMTREEVEALYPLHRGRYWTARDAAINNRFGRTVFPFLESTIIEGTESIPIAYKQYGRLEARMIQIIRPSLARYPTTRGFSPAEPVPLGYKLMSQLNIRRPPWLRPYSYRLRHLRPCALPEHLREAALLHVIDPALPVMRAYFHPEHIHDAAVFNRVCTMEWLSQSPARAATRARRGGGLGPVELVPPRRPAGNGPLRTEPPALLASPLGAASSSENS
jgi:asparagine synthase (glutamine-hydrolysing)